MDDITSGVIDRNREIVRQSLDRVKAIRMEITNDLVNDCLDYFEYADNTTQLLRDKLKQRGALGISKESAGSGTNVAEEGGYETYRKQAISELIDSGGYEIVTTGVGRKIAGALTIFDRKDQAWQWHGEDQEEDDEDTTKIITAHRTAGGFSEALQGADYMAASLDTGPMLIDWKSDHINYRAFSPANLYACFHGTVIDNGQTRGVDYTDIEDATVVVVQLNKTLGSDAARVDRQQYLGVWGRSEDYPNGRYCVYTARHWYEWPDPYKGDYEYEIREGEIANPLSYAANQHADFCPYEYPVILVRGGLALTPETINPISTSLYEVSLEIDIAMSRLLKDGLNSSLGIKAVTTEDYHTQIPRCLEGAVLLHKGMGLQLLSQPASNTQGALEIVQALARTVAEGYGVPGYQVFAEPAGVPESGIALLIRTGPLREAIDRRTELNRATVDRIWQIERALITHYNGQSFGDGILQTWQAGRYQIPEAPEAKVARLNQAQQSGYIDYVTAVREYHGFATDKQAIDYIEKLNERRLSYSQPKQIGAGALQLQLPPRAPREI